MAIAIDATAGGASANSFATLAEADTYMTARLNASTWETDASDDTKNRALVEAARELDPMAWDGIRTASTQALSWPRSWAYDPDSPVQDYFTTTVVPQRVKDAQCELAFQFVKAGTTDVAARDATQGVIEKTIDVLTTKWAAPIERSSSLLSRYPRVSKFVNPLLVGSRMGNPLVKG